MKISKGFAMVGLGLLMGVAQGQSVTSGFTVRLNQSMGGSGFNNVDSSAGVHVLTNRADTGDRIDMDNDGNFEFVIMAKNTTDNIFIFEATGDNTYTQVWGFDPNSGTGSVTTQAAAMADSDGDGRLELIYSDGAIIRVFEYSGAGQITDGSNPSDVPVTTESIPSIMGLTVGNLDGDASLDLVVCTLDELDSLKVLENDGDNSFAAAMTTDVGNDSLDNDTDGGCASVSQVADLDGDGNAEVVVAPDEEARTLDAFFVYNWDGVSAPTEEARLPIAAHVSGTPGINNVLVYNIDEAGNPEIVLTENEFRGVYVYESTAANTYASDQGGAILNTGGNVFNSDVGDYDANGSLELYIPEDPGDGSESALFMEHTGAVGAFSASDFSAATAFVTDLGNDGGGGISNDVRGLAYAQGSLDGDSMGDLVLITQSGNLIVIEADASGSQVPVELQQFSID